MSWFSQVCAAYIAVDRSTFLISFNMQSLNAVESLAKRKYIKKDKSDPKPQKKKKKLETDSALKTDPAKEIPEPMVVEKNFVLKDGQWVEETDAAIQTLMAEVDKIPQIGSPPRAPLVDLLSCPFHLKPLTRKKPPEEIEKQEVLFCPELDCPVFLFANNIDAYLHALHFTLPSKDVAECWDILQCHCHWTPVLKLSQSETNPNRLYLSCNNWNKELRCRYFQWFDEAFSKKNAAWQDEMRFEFQQLPVPASRAEAKRKAQEHKEVVRKRSLVDYFTNLKEEMEEKRKNRTKPDGGSGGGGGGARGDGGGIPRRDARTSPFLYYTRAVPSSNNWGITEQPYESIDF